MNKLILVSGRKQTGKDTLAELFVETGYQRVALADQLKFQTLQLLNDIVVPKNKLTFQDFFENKEMVVDIMALKQTPKTATIRRWLQRYSMLIKEMLGTYYWADMLIKEIREYHLEKHLVVADVRFPYEIERFYDQLALNYDIHLIRILRDTGYNDQDISETALDDYNEEAFDFIIDNNASMEDLKKKFDKIFKKIHKR